MPQKFIVPSYGVIVGYSYDYALFHKHTIFRMLNSYRSRDSWIRIIVHQLEILVFEIKNALDFWVYLHLWKLAGLAAKLGRHLLEMIYV